MKAPFNKFKYSTLDRVSNFNLSDIVLLVERRKTDSLVCLYIKNISYLDHSYCQKAIRVGKRWDIHFLPLLVGGKRFYNWTPFKDYVACNPIQRAIFSWNNGAFEAHCFSVDFPFETTLNMIKPDYFLILK